MTALRWITGVLVAPLTLVRWLLRGRQEWQEQKRHCARLADEIIEVARSVESDLFVRPSSAEIVEMRCRCASYRERAERALRATLTHRLPDEMDRIVGQLHEDHWRMVNLRSDVDTLLAESRSARPTDRLCKFATGSKPSRPRWSSTGSHTRPTTLE